MGAWSNSRGRTFGVMQQSMAHQTRGCFVNGFTPDVSCAHSGTCDDQHDDQMKSGTSAPASGTHAGRPDQADQPIANKLLLINYN